MIDLFEKVRNDIPQEYRYAAEKAMAKVNECFVLGFPYEFGWRRVPWFDKIYTYSVSAPITNQSISFVMSFQDEFLMLDVYEDGHAELYQSNKTCTVNVNLDDENYKRHVNYMFNNVCEEFHKKISVEFAEGDEVCLWYGRWGMQLGPYDVVKGVITDVEKAGYGVEWYTVDLGDGRISKEFAQNLIPLREEALAND